MATAHMWTWLQHVTVDMATTRVDMATTHVWTWLQHVWTWLQHVWTSLAREAGMSSLLDKMWRGKR
eukprot:1193414-Prorocentrum_minimum.AAC.2